MAGGHFRMPYVATTKLMYAEYEAGLAKINRGAIAVGQETNRI